MFYIVLKKFLVTGHMFRVFLLGYIPGHCESSTYLVGHAYILRAYNEGESDEQLQLAMAGTHINATQENLEGITKACGLNPVTRPTGAHAHHRLYLKCHPLYILKMCI